MVSRALPAVALTAVLLVLSLATDGWIGVLGCAAVALSVPRLLSRGWWHYVRFGERLHPPVAARFVEAGDHRVELSDVGPRYIYVIKALRTVAGLDLLSAKLMADEVPSIVAEGISLASAEAITRELADAGATARVLA